MSLINDALKRAKRARQPDPPPDGSYLQFRPAENPGQPQAPSKLTFAALMFAFLLLSLVVFGVLLPGELNRRVKAKAAVRPEQATFVEPGGVGASSAISKGARNGATSRAAPGMAAPVSGTPTTNTAGATVATTPPKPASPRLQAVFFDPARPSAIIDGKTVFVGSRVGEFQVVTIGPNNTTLVSGKQTIVLTIK